MDERLLGLIALAHAAAKDAILDVDPEQYPSLYWQMLAEQFTKMNEAAYDRPELQAGLLDFLGKVRELDSAFQSDRIAFSKDHARKRELYENRLRVLMVDPRELRKRDDAPGGR